MAQRFVDATLKFATNGLKIYGRESTPSTVHYFLIGVAIQIMALEAVS